MPGSRTLQVEACWQDGNTPSKLQRMAGTHQASGHKHWWRLQTSATSKQQPLATWHTHTWRKIKGSLTFVPKNKSLSRFWGSNPTLDNVPMVMLQGSWHVFQGKGLTSNKRQQGNCKRCQGSISTTKTRWSNSSFGPRRTGMGTNPHLVHGFSCQIMSNVNERKRTQECHPGRQALVGGNHPHPSHLQIPSQSTWHQTSDDKPVTWLHPEKPQQHSSMTCVNPVGPGVLQSLELASPTLYVKRGQGYQHR